MDLDYVLAASVGIAIYQTILAIVEAVVNAWCNKTPATRDKEWQKAASEYQRRVETAKAFGDPPRPRWKKVY